MTRINFEVINQNICDLELKNDSLKTYLSIPQTFRL